MATSTQAKTAGPSEGLTTSKTFCRICPAFCGLEVTTDGSKIVKILPDQDNEYNWRDFCLKGGSSHQWRDHPKRITTPMKRVDGQYVAVSYEQAIKEIAAQLNDIRERHGVDAIATYTGNPGQLNGPNAMFQGGFIAGLGSTNNYTVGSVDQNAFNLVAKEMYGSEMALLIPDVDHAKCMLFLGMNPVASYFGWMYTMANGWKRVLAAQKNGADLIMVDPQETASTKKANTHIKIRPGEDWAFLLAIIKLVFQNEWEHKEDCAEAVDVDLIKDIAEQASLDYLANRCNVSVEQIHDIAKRFALAETAVCAANSGVSLSRNGTLGEWLSQVLNLITGRVDRKGGRFFQSGIFDNTMKMVNKLSSAVKRRSRIGGFRSIGGGFPLATLPEEITTPGEGQIRALIINSGNPVIGGPDGKRLDAALEELELLISVDLFQRESHRHAHWLIPGTHMLEREEFLGLAVSSLFEQPHIQFGHAVIAPLNNIKPEWQFFRDLAVEMKVPFMGIRGLNTFIRGSRWLAKITGKSCLAFNPRWMWALFVKTASSLKWKDIINRPSGYLYGEKSYGRFKSRLQTNDGRIHAAPADFVDILTQRLSELLPQKNTDYPLQLVNQRHLSMMNSWLVDTVKRTTIYGDYIEINPSDAADNGIEDEQAVTVQSSTGCVDVKARISNKVPTGIVSMPHGWGSRLFDPMGNGNAEVQGINRNLLVSADGIDELSGIPNMAGTCVKVQPA